jgi:hypothetical protein
MTRVICPNCLNEQDETNHRVGDKFAWKCKKCEAIIEDGWFHKLQRLARYTAKVGGNVCTGFGGILGGVTHRKYDAPLHKEERNDKTT